jgi:hypothetical protein
MILHFSSGKGGFFSSPATHALTDNSTRTSFYHSRKVRCYYSKVSVFWGQLVDQILLELPVEVMEKKTHACNTCGRPFELSYKTRHSEGNVVSLRCMRRDKAPAEELQVRFYHR